MTRADRIQIEARQAKAEEEYLALHERFQNETPLSPAESETHLRLFSQARALEAALRLDDEDYDDAVYEALHAAPEGCAVTRLRELLGGT